jgi:hypothetical protein
MATETAAQRTILPRGELTVAVLAVVSLALIPLRITTIYSGLPAHPLFLHIPVILSPVAALGALALVIRPRWFARFGVPIAGLTVVALAGTLLTVGAGLALRAALHLNAAGGAGAIGPAALIARHANAALVLRALMIAFTGVLILTVLVHTVAAGRHTDPLDPAGPLPPRDRRRPESLRRSPAANSSPRSSAPSTQRSGSKSAARGDRSRRTVGYGLRIWCAAMVPAIARSAMLMAMTVRTVPVAVVPVRLRLRAASTA